MGTKYTSQSITGYNSSPPADDGSTIASNKITWAGIKSKLADALNTFIAAINTQLVTALDYSASTTSSNYTTVAGDHQKPIQVSATATISLGDATTMAAGYQTEIFNTGTGLVTVTPITGTDTLNGTAGASVVLSPFTGAKFCVNQAANGYNLQATSKPYRQGADIASASTANLRTSTGDYINITGTTGITAITLDKGDERTVQFSGILTLTNGASLILPGGANITTAAGDTAIFRGEASSVVRCIAYSKASGQPLINAPTIQKFTANGTYTKPAGLRAALVMVKGGGASGGTNNAVNAIRGGGGGEGETCWRLIAAASIGATETVTIGGGGAAVTAGTGAAGNAGVTTSFGTLVTAAGGSGGTAGQNGGAGGLGGTGGSNADWNEVGAPGQVGADSTGSTVGMNAAGGGRGGGASGTAAVANTGAGGGSGSNSTASGAGGSGKCVVIEYY